MDNLSIHVRLFNEKVRIMTQSGKKDLILTAQDARNLHADIFALLTHVAELSGKSTVATTEPVTVSQIAMDGGGF